MGRCPVLGRHLPAAVCMLLPQELEAMPLCPEVIGGTPSAKPPAPSIYVYSQVTCGVLDKKPKQSRGSSDNTAVKDA